MQKNRGVGVWCLMALGSAACTGGGTDGAMNTGIDGERFASLEATSDSLSGVFEKGGQSLVFKVSVGNGTSELRLMTLTGEELFASSSSSTGSEMRVGGSFRGFLPAAGGGPSSPFDRKSSPTGFQSSGDLIKAMEAVKGTPLALLPSLSAALGRVGLVGARSPLAMVIHLTALQLAQQEGFTLENAVVEASNRAIAGPNSASTPVGGGDVSVVTGALSENYSYSIRCNSGVDRQFFGTTLDGDPCRDQCFGMCGPGCTPWTWLCNDRAVHALCWQHDSAYCPAWLGSVLGFSIPNPDYGLCLTEYAAYTSVVGGLAALSLCEDDSGVPLGLWRHRPEFYTEYGTATADGPDVVVAPPVRGFANFHGGIATQSSDLPGYDGYPHGAAQARDSTFEGNFFNGTTSHTNAGYLSGAAIPTSSPYAGQYWMLDFGTLKELRILDIYTRTDYATGPLQDIAVFVWVGDGTIGWKVVADGEGAQLTALGQEPGANGNKEEILLPEGTVSQYVLIQKKNDTPLEMAEVETFANNVQ